MDDSKHDEITVLRSAVNAKNKEIEILKQQLEAYTERAQDQERLKGLAEMRLQNLKDDLNEVNELRRQLKRSCATLLSHLDERPDLPHAGPL